MFSLTSVKDEASSSAKSSDSDSSDSSDRGTKSRRPPADRVPAAAVAAVPGGVLKLFVGVGEDDDSLYIRAYCDCHGKKCMKRRTLLARKGGAQTAQGRPVGYLLAWLRRGTAHDVLHAKQHKRRVKVTRGQRKEGRAYAKTQESLRTFLENERDRWPGEGSEPDNEP